MEHGSHAGEGTTAGTPHWGPESLVLLVGQTLQLCARGPSKSPRKKGMLGAEKSRFPGEEAYT